MARINLYLAPTIVERASFMAESKLTCLTPAATREFKIEPESQITEEDKMMVESKTRRAKEVLKILGVLLIITYLGFPLYIQLHEQ